MHQTTQQTNSFVIKPVSFISAGCRLAGDLYLPKHDSAQATAADAAMPLPAIVLCQGFAAVKELLLPAYAEHFAANGFAALLFDYRGFGKSEGELGRLVPRMQIEDIKQAITFLTTQIDVNVSIDKARIGLWGTSYGGANALVAASEDPRVKCLCAQVTFGDGERVVTGSMAPEEVARFKGMLGKMQQKKAATGNEMMVPISKILSDEQSKKFFEEYAERFPELKIKIPFLTVAETMSHKPEQAAKNISVPTLIVGAAQDGVNPIAESHHLFNALPAATPKELMVVDGATHFELYTGDYFAKVVAKELEWFKQYLMV
jgi:uncharacterized protein